MTIWRFADNIKIKIGETPRKEMTTVYPNLLGQKAYYHLTDAQMGKIIGVSRTTYGQKLRHGKFWPDECRAFCKYFNKSFAYLFATEAEILVEYTS